MEMNNLIKANTQYMRIKTQEIRDAQAELAQTKVRMERAEIETRLKLLVGEFMKHTGMKPPVEGLPHDYFESEME